MTKRKRRALTLVSCFFGIGIVGLAVFFATLNQDRAKKYITTAVSKATGRQLNINGDLKLKLGWISQLSASEIQFQNADWSKRPQMAELGLLNVEVDLWQLVRHFRVVLPTVTISQPNVVLEKNAEGSANWEFRTATAVTEPAEKRSNVPVIQKLIIKDGVLLFDNQETKNQIKLKVTEAESAGFLETPVKLKAEGTYQSLPFTLSLDGGLIKT
jgi:AsmA family protein